MNIYFLTNTLKQAPWQNEYETIYLNKLLEKNVRVKQVGLLEITTLKPTDVLWVMHYLDFLTQEVRACKALKVAQVNGTAANPYCYQVNEKAEREAIENVLDINFVFNERQRLVMEKVFPKAKFLAVGFPVTVPNDIKPAKLRKPKIIIAGRISPDKQFYLATYLLKDLANYYQIIFAYPSAKEEKWLELYHTERFTNFVIKQYDRINYLKELSDAEFYFSCSLGDISSVSLVESLLLGCYPIIPKFREGLPTYDEYVSVGYEPFSKVEVEKLIRTKPKFTWQYNDSDSELCTQRVIKGLENEIHNRH
jgi:hypothetical protein